MIASRPSTTYSFWALCVVGFFAILSSTMSKNPVLNPFTRTLGTPEPMMGVIAAASTIPGVLASLPAGSFSDMFGRRRVLFLSGTIFATAPLLYLLVSSWWHLMLVRFYHGFATAVFVPVSNAYVAELFPNRRGERISLFSSMTTIGRTAAPFLGGYILFITSYNFHQLYMVVGVAGFVAFVTGLLLLGKDPQNQARTQISTRRTGSRLVQGWLTVAKNPRILATSLIEASQYYAFGATEFFLVGYLKEVARFDPVTIGVVTGSQIAVIPILKPLMGRLSDKVGRTAPIVFGSLISALSLAAIPFILKFILLLLISMSFGIGFSMVTSSTPALISELTDENLMGTGMGFLGTIMDLGQTLGPIITGFILAAGFGYVGSFLALTMVLLVTCTVFSLAEFSARRESEHA